MKHPISAAYGDTLEQAAAKAVAERAHLAQLLDGLWPSFEFDFHGLTLPLKADTTAADLVAEVDEAYAVRSCLYDDTPAAADAFEREQGGKIDEPLEDCVVSAVQCGARWGNTALREDSDSLARLRHVFEFNGIRVPFNPWKQGEAERVLAEVNARLPAGASRRVALPESALS